MARLDLNNLSVFVVVARERNFTRAAARLGVSQSAVSHTIKILEERLGVRLLSRTTRGVSPTEAGERLFERISPFYDGIEHELNSLDEHRTRPVGTVRISAHDHAATAILWPRLSKLLPHYPELKIEITISNGFIDIVHERYDAGVRVGDDVAQDMIAMRMSPDFRMVVVGTPSYLGRRNIPSLPEDLLQHNCINLRLSTHGRLYAWEFVKGAETREIQVSGQMIFSSSPQMLAAALDGYGLAYVPEDVAAPHIGNGRLISMLDDWCPVLPGYHLYYPTRRHNTPAFSIVADALRYRSTRSVPSVDQ